MNSVAFIENIGMPGLCCLTVLVPIAAVVLVVTLLAKQSRRAGSGSAPPRYGGEDDG